VNGGFLFADSFAEGSVGGRAMARSPEDFGPHGAFHREAERALGRSLTLAEASSWHRLRTLADLARNPGRALRLTLRKLRLLASARELDDNLGFPMARERSGVLAWLPSPWAWFLAPAVAGAVLGLRARGAAGPLAVSVTAYAAAYMASLLMFFVNARYRLPLVVPLAVLSGIGVDLAWRARKRPGRTLLAAAGAAAAVAAIAVADPGVRTDPAFELLAVGAALQRDGRHTEALEATDAALALAPALPAAHQNRALSLLALDRREEALRATGEAVRLDPDLAQAWITRGAILAEDGRVEEALPAFLRAAGLLPDDPAALGNLALALHATGRHAEAIVTGHRAVEAGARDLAATVAAWEAETE
jgi:tetratricopeptide (TPR) repeat protein